MFNTTWSDLDRSLSNKKSWCLGGSNYYKKSWCLGGSNYYKKSWCLGG
jgi:hypothetical protein